MGAVSPPLRCRCRTLVQHAEAVSGPPIVVEPGSDPHGDVVLVRAAGKMRYRLVQPGETFPRSATRLVHHQCPADAPPEPAQRDRYLDQALLTEPTPAMVAAVAGMLEQGYPLDRASTRAVAVLVLAGFEIEPIGLVSPCTHGCGRSVTHPPKERPVCDDCGRKGARRRKASR